MADFTENLFDGDEKEYDAGAPQGAVVDDACQEEDEHVCGSENHG